MPGSFRALVRRGLCVPATPGLLVQRTLLGSSPGHKEDALTFLDWTRSPRSPSQQLVLRGIYQCHCMVTCVTCKPFFPPDYQPQESEGCVSVLFTCTVPGMQWVLRKHLQNEFSYQRWEGELRRKEKNGVSQDYPAHPDAQSLCWNKSTNLSEA